ncbi:MAG: hypothetical protein II937_09515 [Bacteroidales bacterium]|nr:hypothetical protein [Bacteroidales bacterium]
MEITDLMVGDLVIKHTATRGDMVCTVTPSIIGSYDFDWSPIPITEEFFEKNSKLARSDEKDYVEIYVFDVGDDADDEVAPLQIVMDGYDTWDIVRRVPSGLSHAPYYQMNFATIRYVHELQHALRLVGLKDVANKLIVE